MINEAKKAVAGLQLMTEVIDAVKARRPDIVEDALEKALGLKEDASEDAFNAAMDKRVEKVTQFDELEEQTQQLKFLVANIFDGLQSNVPRSALIRRCKKVLNK